jgi:hypothetical protein
LGSLSGFGDAIINCSIKKLILSNYTRNFQSTSSYYPAVRIAGANTVINKLVIDGFSIDTSFHATLKTGQIEVDSATVRSFSFLNSTIRNTYIASSDSTSIISIKRGATVTELILNGISNNGVSRILTDSATVRYLSATNIRHVSADTSIAPFFVYSTSSIWDFALSNFWGFKITTGTFDIKRGDGFEGLPTFH